MSKLTHEEVNAFCGFLKNVIANTGYKDTNAERCEQIDSLRDMALSSLDRDGVVVPREPTQKMFDAGYAAAAFPRDPEICAAMWRAMYDAAPQPEPISMGQVDTIYAWDMSLKRWTTIRKPGDPQPPREGKEEG